MSKHFLIGRLYEVKVGFAYVGCHCRFYPIFTKETRGGDSLPKYQSAHRS